MFTLSTRSLCALEGVHPDLQAVVRKAGELCDARQIDFIITGGCRSIAQQQVYVAQGKSKTMHSRHLGGFAVDYVALVDHRVTYDESPMRLIAQAFKEAASELSIPVHWGGDWSSFQDTPHIELDKARYPDVAI